MASRFGRMSKEDLEGHLDAINEASLLGVTEVTFQGQTTKYRSLSQMDRVAQIIVDELNRREGKKRTRRYLFRNTGGF